VEIVMSNELSPIGTDTVVSDAVLEKELTTAYAAAQQCFTLLLTLIGAAVAADAAVIVAAFKAPEPMPSPLAVGGVIVLLAVWGTLLLGQGVGNLGVTILRVERQLHVSTMFSPAYAVLQTYGEAEQRTIMKAVTRDENTAGAVSDAGLPGPPSLFSWRQWPILAAIVLGISQVIVGLLPIVRLFLSRRG
jgi:hypothetical protein